MMQKVEICGVDTSGLPLLTSKENEELMKKLKTGDKAAREKFIVGNMRLVLSLVKRFWAKNANADDVFQAGCVGLIKAIDNFDLSVGVKFSTYAVPKIAGEIRRFLRDDGAVKVSRGLKERAGAIRSARERLSARLGREPALSELAEETGLEPEEIAAAEEANLPVASLQMETGDGFTLESVLGTEGMEEAIVEREALRGAVAALPERERQVILLRYFRGMTQDRTAKVLGVSQVQVSRIERKAVEHLRRKLE